MRVIFAYCSETQSRGIPVECKDRFLTCLDAVRRGCHIPLWCFASYQGVNYPRCRFRYEWRHLQPNELKVIQLLISCESDYMAIRQGYPFHESDAKTSRKRRCNVAYRAQLAPVIGVGVLSMSRQDWFYLPGKRMAIVTKIPRPPLVGTQRPGLSILLSCRSWSHTEAVTSRTGQVGDRCDQYNKTHVTQNVHVHT